MSGTKKVKIEEFVSYNGHNVKANGTVTLNFKAMYSELVKTINVLQLLNNDVRVSIKDTRLGSFRVKDVVVDGDGESKIKFDSMTDFVEMDEINKLVSAEGEFKISMEADIELEDDEENEAEEEIADENDEEDDEGWDDVEEDDWGDDE